MRERTFTSYINSEILPGTEAKFLQLERIADRTFTHIQQRAALAARATAGLTGGGIGTAGAARMGAAAGDASRIAAANAVIQRSSNATSMAVARQSAEISRLERRNAALAQGLRSTATALQVVQGPLGPIAGRITALSNAMERLTGFRLGMATVGASLFALTAAANRAAEVRSRLVPLFETQAQVNSEFAKTARIARDTRTALEPVVDLYARLTMVGRDVDLSPMRIERTTRAAALGARISGGARQAQQAALTQLAQGIGSNRLGGEELRSIMEQAPRIAQAIAQGLSNTEHFGNVTMGMLRNLGAEGELTAERVTRALSRSLGRLEEEARRLGPTMASSMSAFGTEFTVAVSNLDQAVGLTRTMAGAIQFAADNMREFVALTLGVATAWAAVKIAPMLPQRIDQMRDFVNRQKEAGAAQRAAAEAERKAAQDSLTLLSRRSDSLRQQRTYIEGQTRALEAQVAVQRQQVNRLAPQAALGAGVVGGSGIIREHSEAVERLRQSEERLGRQYRVLNGIQISQANNTRSLTRATLSLDDAKKRAAASTSRLRMVGGALLNAINPLGIAMAVLTTAIFELALAESRAERNAKRLEEIQRQLADTIDETTGRVREQNAELLRGHILRSQEAETLAGEQFTTSRQQIARQMLRDLTVGHRGATEAERMAGSRGSIPIMVGGAGGAQAQRLLNDLFNGRGNLAGIAGTMQRLAEANPGNRQLREAADRLSRALPDLTSQLRAQLTEQSRQRAYEGRATEEDRRRLRGDFSGGRVEGRTPAQLQAEAEAERQRLRDPRYRATTTRDTALQQLEVRAAQMSHPEYIRERAQILHSYDEEIAQIERADAASGRRAQNEENRQERMAEAARDKAEQLANLMQGFEDDAPVRQLERVFDQAERAKREIQDLIGEQVDGIGRFSAQDAETRIQQIEESVRRQSGRFLDSTMERFQEDTPIRRMRELATAAREAKRDIDALVGRSVDGYEQGFTQGDADRLKASIDDFVRAEQRRPMTEFLRQQEEQLRIQALILQGREAEAQALEEIFNLQQQMGPLSEAEMQALVRNAEQQQRINDLIADRQRAVENLLSVSEDARQTIEQTLGELSHGRIDRAAKALFEGMTESFFRVRIRQLTEQLMAGTDRRIRDLVQGRTRVDIAVDQVSSGMTTAGSAALEFADRLREAAARVDAVQPQAAAAGATGPGMIDAAAAAVTRRFDTSSAGRFFRIAAPLARMVVGGDNYAQHVARGSHGVDLRAGAGTAVMAPFSGTLTFNHTQRGGLQAFITSLDGRLRAGFSHLNAITLQQVRQGVRVEMGQVFARSGNTGINPATGRSVDPHLHSTMYVNGRSVDPMRYFGRTIDFGAGGSSAAAAVSGGVTPGAARTQMQAVGGIIGELAASFRREDEAAATAAREAQAGGAAVTRAILGAARSQTRTAQTQERAAVRQDVSIREVYNTLGTEIGRNIDHALGTRFAEKLGGKLGDVMVGAGKGQMASGVARMLGIKQSNTGAAVGGAIGQLAAPLLGPLAPFAPFLGGLLGGTIGGLFKKTPKGSTTVSVGEFGNFVTGGTTGTSSALRDAAEQLGGSVGDTLQQIADALYGTIGGAGSVSIGQRKGKFVVDPTGRGRTKGSGVMKFDDEQSAVEAAVKIMLQKGVIAGISAASQNILKKGKDLQTAITKAAAIEAIPRRLMQLQDPVRYAVTELNREFSQLIGYLKEGGASAEQFAQAQQLYDLERQRAVEQAQQQAAGQIQSFLDEMTGGQSSPLNRRTVFDNAKAQIDRFTADINAGKVVDEGKLLEAARNFQDASGALKGRGEGFFADFDWLFQLLSKAKANATAGVGTAPLPASPFASDPAIQRIIDAANGTNSAIDNQTGVLGDLLTQIRDLMGGFGGSAGTGSSIDILPGFLGGGGGNRMGSPGGVRPV